MAREVEQRSVEGVMKGGLVWLALLLFCALSLAACKGGKSSSVEGKLVDWDNKPVAGVKITASQVQPIKGYEQFEAVTGADGSFALKGLFPSSAYVLKPWSDKWTTKVELQVDSAPQGETAVLPQPMQIEMAYGKKGGGKVIDLATGALRFEVSAEGVITDGQTKLDWVVGPDKNTDYDQATQWVASCQAAGGGWRMPTRVELKTLVKSGVGRWNMDPAFETSNHLVWAEPNGSSSAWYFNFDRGEEGRVHRDGYRFAKVFGVRSLHDDLVKDINEHITNKKYHEAVELLTKAMEIKPEPWMYMRRGRLYQYEMQEYAKAEQDFMKCAEIAQPKTSDFNSMCYSFLSYMYATCKESTFRDGKKAVSYGLKAYSLKPEDPGINFRLAAAYARNSQFDKAIELQQKSIDLVRASNISSEDQKKEFTEMGNKRIDLYKKQQPYESSK